MPSHARPSRTTLVLIVLLSGAGLAVLVLLLRQRRRTDRGQDEPGEDIGYGAADAVVDAPESVLLGGDVPDHPDEQRWEDQSDRRRLPLGAYRAAPDEPETEPEAAP